MSETNRKPEPWFFDRARAEALYAIEAKRASLLEKVAHVWRKAWNEVFGERMEGRHLIGESQAEFWGIVMPQVLFDTLEAYSPSVSRSAAVAWLQYDASELRRGRRTYDPAQPNPFVDLAVAEIADPDVRTQERFEFDQCIRYVTMSVESAEAFIGKENVAKVEDAGPADPQRYRAGARLFLIYPKTGARLTAAHIEPRSPDRGRD